MEREGCGPFAPAYAGLGVGLLMLAVRWLVVGSPRGYVVGVSLLGGGVGLCAVAFWLWPRRG